MNQQDTRNLRKSTQQSKSSRQWKARGRRAGGYRMRWHVTGSRLLRPGEKVVSKRITAEIHVLLCGAPTSTTGYTSGAWGPTKQWQERGPRSRRARRRQFVVFENIRAERERDGGPGGADSRRLLPRERLHVLTPPRSMAYTSKPATRFSGERFAASSRAERFSARLGLSPSSTGGTTPANRRRKDVIHCRPLLAAAGCGQFYSTSARAGNTRNRAAPQRLKRELRHGSPRRGSLRDGGKCCTSRLACIPLLPDRLFSNGKEEEHAAYLSKMAQGSSRDQAPIFAPPRRRRKPSTDGPDRATRLKQRAKADSLNHEEFTWRTNHAGREPHRPDSIAQTRQL